MAKVDYYKFHKAFVETIENHKGNQFRHIPRQEWIDDEGKLAQSKVNNTFSVLIEGKAEDEDFINIESVEHSPIKLDVQFALDFRKDNYLKFLGDCEEAVVESYDTVFSESTKFKYNPEFELIPEGDKIRVVFNEIKILMRNK